MSTRTSAQSRVTGTRWFTIVPADRPDFVWRLTVTAQVSGSAALPALAAALGDAPDVRRVEQESAGVLLVDGFVPRSVLVAWCADWWEETGSALARVRVPQQRSSAATSRRRGALRLWSR